jgi:AAHS family 4-hydroxybenzoate transporter-like MFS transporter
MTTVSVHDFIDARPFGPLQIRVVALCAMVVFMDGFDTQAIGYVAPAIVRSWQVDRSVLGPVFAAGLVGLMMGALGFGPVADRFGRKPVLVGCTLWFGVLTLMTAAAWSIESLLVLRWLTGFGLGGAMPNAIALTTEYTPPRIRATTVMVMFCGFSLGAAFGGIAAAGLIDEFGWRSVFVVGGIAPCVAFLPLLLFLPESIRFLALSGRHQELARIVRKIDPAMAWGDGAAFSAEPRRSGHFPVRQLFMAGRAPLTLLLWVVFFMSLLDLFFISNWLPTVVHDSGVSLDRAVVITAMFQVGGVVGTFFLGRLFDRFSPFRALAVTYLGASVLILLIGTAGTSFPLLLVTVCAAGFCVIGGQTGANALTANAYPTSIRSTAVGWALGIGRIGSIVGPIVGGVLLSLGWEAKPLFRVAALPVLVAASAAFLIDALGVVGRGLEEDRS